MAGFLLMAGCRPQQAATGGNHQERRQAAIWRADTVVIRDSVAVARTADTVFVTRTRMEWRTRAVSDTVRVAVTDTVRVAAPSPAPAAERAGGVTGVIKWLVVLVIAACLFVFLLKK